MLSGGRSGRRTGKNRLADRGNDPGVFISQKGVEVCICESRIPKGSYDFQDQRLYPHQGKPGDHGRYRGIFGSSRSKGLQSLSDREGFDGKKLEGFQVQSVKDEIYRQIEENIPDRPSKHYKKSAAMGIVDTLLEELKKEGKEG